MEVWVFFGVAMLVLATLFVWIAVRRRRIAVHRQAQEQSRDPMLFPGTTEYEARFRNPDVEAVEAAVGTRLPESLRRLYLDLDTVTREGFQAVGPDGRTWPLARFVPLDAAGLANNRWGLGSHAVPIARGPEGETYFVPLDEASPDDAPVDRMGSDGERTERVADSLADFHTRSRVGIEGAAALSVAGTRH